MTTDQVQRTIEAVWRIESAKLVAAIARLTRDVGLAEDLAQDALVAAMDQWPRSGVPDRPGAWLLAAARRRAIDALRRDRTFARKREEIAARIEAEAEAAATDLDAALDDEVGDDLLRLIFAACHPILSAESRAALTLRILGGLTTYEIARAFLIPEPTVAQRIVRAKKTLAEKAVPLEIPRGDAMAARLASVLEVVYLIFNEGYAAAAGEDWSRPALCEEALRLGRLLAELAPAEPEVHGLVALMEIQASRLRARTAADGSPILLLDQDRSRWDRLLIRRGLAAIARAEALGRPPGPYLLQASIAACHARALAPEATDWPEIARLYGELARVAPSAVVELNRAMAVAMAEGPAAGLAILDALAGETVLHDYPYFYSARGDLLAKLERTGEAVAMFKRAADRTRNARERSWLMGRIRACWGLVGEPRETDMFRYRDGNEIHVDDHVRHAGASAFVERLVVGDDVEAWGLEEPGFLLVCEQCGRILIEPGSYDWEDVEFVRRGSPPPVRPSS